MGRSSSGKGDILPIQQDAARIRLEEAADQVKGGGFPTAGRPQKGDKLLYRWKIQLFTPLSASYSSLEMIQLQEYVRSLLLILRPRLSRYMENKLIPRVTAIITAWTAATPIAFSMDWNSSMLVYVLAGEIRKAMAPTDVMLEVVTP